MFDLVLHFETEKARDKFAVWLADQGYRNMSRSIK